MSKFTKVSEYIAAKTMDTGLYLMENIVGETEKAVAFAVQKWNATATSTYVAKCWMPKSKIQKVENDFYIHGEKTMYLAPVWLIQTKQAEGFEL